MSTSLGEKSSLLENSFYSSDCVLSHPNARRLEESNQGASINPSRGTLREIFALIKGPERLWSVLFTSIVIALASLSFGYAFGFPSPTLLQLSDPNFIGNVSRADFQVNSKKDIFAGLLSTGGAIGGLTFGALADCLGRKKGIIIIQVLFLIGWAVVALTRLLHGVAFFALIYMGIFIIGYASGSINLIAPMYISEISPARLRGFLGCIPELSLDIGICFVYFLGAIPCVSDYYSYLSYYYLAAIAFGMAIVNLILFFPVKESPHWLIHNGFDIAAKKCLKWLRGSSICIDTELERLQNELAENKEHTLKETLKMLKRPYVWKPLVLMLVILSLQQLVGITAVNYFVGPIFEMASIENANEVAAISAGVFQVLGTFVCLILADFIGRRMLMFASSLGLTLSSATLGVYLFFFFTHNCKQDPKTVQQNTTFFAEANNLKLNVTKSSDIFCESSFSWLAIVSIAMYTFSFELGWGGIPRLLSSEVFPIAIRGKCMSIGFFVNWSIGVVISYSFNSYQALVHPFGAFWIFTGFSFLSFFFVLIFLPETKGKTLHEIEDFFASGHFCQGCNQSGNKCTK